MQVVGKFGRWKEEEEGRKGGWTADGWKLTDGGMMSACEQEYG